MKRIVIFIIAFYSSCLLAKNTNSCKSLEKEISSWINNENFDYSIVRASDFKDGVAQYIGHRVMLTLSDKQIDIFKNIDNKTWLKLMNNLNTDFAANLILYYLYEKDPIAIIVVDGDIKLWRAIAKKDDLTYWREHLK